MSGEKHKLQKIKTGKPFSKLDFVVISLAIILSLGYIIYMLSVRQEGSTVLISAKGQPYYFSLSENRTVNQDDLQLENAQIEITISGGKVFVSYSACSNQICAHHHAIKYAGETIVCVPQKVHVRILGGLNVAVG